MKKKDQKPKGGKKKEEPSISGLACQIMKTPEPQDAGVEENGRYTLTPRGVLVMVLSEFIKDIREMNTFEKLIERVNKVEEQLLKGFSGIATGGDRNDLFGTDINNFFSTYVKACNEAGRMRQLLIDNGIDPDQGKEEA